MGKMSMEIENGREDDVMITKTLNRCNNMGLFKDYPQEHIVLSYFMHKRPVVKNRLLESSGEYDTFMLNLNKVLYIFEQNFSKELFEKIIQIYLSCKSNYSDDGFFEKYSNLIVLCGLYSVNNYDSSIWEIDVSENELFCTYTDINGVRTKVEFRIWECRKIPSNGEFVSLYYSLKKNKQNCLEQVLKEMNVELCHLSDELMKEYINSLTPQENLRYIQVIQARDIESLFEVLGLLYNEKTGLYVSNMLIDEEQEEKLNALLGTLLFKPNKCFLIMGDYRNLICEMDGFFLANTLRDNFNLSEIKKNISLFDLKVDKIKCFHMINVSERKDLVEDFLQLFLQDDKKLKEQMVKGIIMIMFEQFPDLYRAFNVDKEEAIEGIYQKYVEFEMVVLPRFPDDHILTRKGIIFDAVGFSLVYAMYIIPTYLKNNVIITDFLLKKLVAQKDGKFNFKMYNEAFSEVEIFLYLFFSIFLKSDLHKEFVRLDYESGGNKNKKFEYSFVFKTFTINVEVKALECAPEIRDDVNFAKMRHGDLFYKVYFPAMNNGIIPEEIKIKGKELKSNYRQIGKNIKRIKEKCIGKTKDINLGFIMINYGTSREEFISYLMHPEYGYLRKNKLNDVDAIVLFSMCMETDLLMDKIMEQEHLLLFANEDTRKKNLKLFEKLRLNNYVDDKSRKYSSYFNEIYGIYRGIMRNKMVSIQRADAFAVEDWSEYDSFQEKSYKIDQLRQLL